MVVVGVEVMVQCPSSHTQTCGVVVEVVCGGDVCDVCDGGRGWYLPRLYWVKRCAGSSITLGFPELPSYHLAADPPN